MILLYTFEGGVKTIVYTDTLQTSGMLIGLIVCVIVLIKAMDVDFGGAVDLLNKKGYTNIFNFDFNSSNFFLKQILGGMFITITMTGLDQEMMQKNISVKTLGSSQKNIMSLSVVLIFVNLLFLFLGGILYLYASKFGITAVGDDLFPKVALSEAFSGTIGIIFIIALISALFPSVDGAITSLTSCFCIDILGFNHSNLSEKEKKKKRLTVHLTFALVFFILVLIFKVINDKSIILFIIKFAGITYGPLLGLFAFGILTKKALQQKYIWLACIIGPLLTLFIDVVCNPAYYEGLLHTKLGLTDLSKSIFHGYIIGPELILVNGIITFTALYSISQKK
jgi:Na+/proline symporter